MKIKFLILTAVAISVLPFNYLFANSAPFSFLRYVSGARSAGLSGAFVSVINDPTALYFNPATISTVENKKFSATFLKHVLDVNSGNSIYIFDYKDWGTFAGSVGYTNYGNFETANSQGDRTGNSFSASDLSFGLSYSQKLDTNLYYGVTLKFIYTGIEQVSTTAFAVDAGLLYKLPDGRSNLGVSVLHAGTQMSKIGNESASLPLDVRIGANHRLRGLPLLMNFSFHHLADETDGFFDKFKHFSIGGELYIGKYVQLRLGYDNQVRNFTSADTDKGLTGFSGGLGIKTNDFNFDYGYSKYGAAASLHRFSIGLEL